VLPDDGSINAFIAGWDDADTVIVATGGALSRLTRAELQGVVAHEMGHLVSGDTQRHMRLIGLVWGLQMVHGLGVRLMAPDDDGRRPAGTLLGLALRVSGYAGWLAGRLLQAAIARQREFHADAAAVQFTRQVDGLGGALRKIAGPQGYGDPQERQTATGRRGLPALMPTRGVRPRLRPPGPGLACLSHLWIAEPAHRRWSLASLLSTHPPLAERLRRLYGRTISVLPAPELPVQALEAEPQAPQPSHSPQAAAAPPRERSPRPPRPPPPAWPPWPDTVPGAPPQGGDAARGR
jgi:Zn-dependent protease with chaperone function